MIDEPSAADMLAPTLTHPGAYTMALCSTGIAVLALSTEDWERDEFEIACQLHSIMGRGILVVVL